MILSHLVTWGYQYNYNLYKGKIVGSLSFCSCWNWDWEVCIFSWQDNMARDLKCKVYVGELGYGATKEELEEKFSKYGPLRSVWVARKPPGFAFVEYEDSRDAQDAVRGMDGV